MKNKYTPTAFDKFLVALFTLMANPIGMIFLLFCALFVWALGSGLGFWR